MRALPDHILQALQAWAMVTMDRTASDLSFGSSFKEVWSKRKRETDFGCNFNPLATKCSYGHATSLVWMQQSLSVTTGFSLCYPLYDDSVMLNMVCNAIYSSLSTESATATFLLHPIGRALMIMLTCRC